MKHANYDQELTSLTNRVIGHLGRESLAVRQMVKNAIEGRPNIDPRDVRTAAAAVSFQLDPDEVFNNRGETRPLLFDWNTLTIVHGISVSIRAGGGSIEERDVWFFNLQRSTRNAIGMPNNRASLTALGPPGDPAALTPMFGEYKVPWTGTLLMDDLTVRMPQTVDRFVMNLHGVELWHASGPISAV